MAASTESLNYVQKMFIAFLGRAGAPAGMEYYAALIDADEESGKAILFDDLYYSEQGLALYSGKETYEIVKIIFNNVMGRDPADAGLIYWTNAINNGDFNVAEAAAVIADSAADTAADLAALEAKTTAADALTDAMEADPSLVAGYQSNFDLARDDLGDVTAANIGSYSAATSLAAISAGYASDTTLTTGNDTVVGTADFVDVVTATVGTGATLTAGDAISDGGTGDGDIVNISGDGAVNLGAPATGISGFETINLDLAKQADTVAFAVTNLGNDVDTLGITVAETVDVVGITVAAEQTATVNGDIAADITTTNVTSLTATTTGTGAYSITGDADLATITTVNSNDAGVTITAAADGSTISIDGADGANDAATISAVGAVALDVNGAGGQNIDDLTLSGNGAAVTYTLAGADAGSEYTITGDQNVTLVGANDAFDGNPLTDSSTAGTTTVNVSSGGAVNFESMGVLSGGIEISGNLAGTPTMTVPTGNTVTLSADQDGNVTFDGNDTAAGGSLTLNLDNDSTASLVFADYETVSIATRDNASAQVVDVTTGANDTLNIAGTGNWVGDDITAGSLGVSMSGFFTANDVTSQGADDSSITISADAITTNDIAVGSNDAITLTATANDATVTTVDAGTGSVSITAGGTASTNTLDGGDISVTGATVTIGGAITASGDVTLDATNDAAASSHAAITAGGDLTYSGGTFTENGNIAVTGTLTVEGGAGLTVTGTNDVSADSILITGDGVVDLGNQVNTDLLNGSAATNDIDALFDTAQAAGTTVLTGSGADDITTNVDSIFNISTGDGNDAVTITNADAFTLGSGDGVDTIVVTATTGTSGVGSTIDAGDGADNITVGTSIAAGAALTVGGGAGGDTVVVNETSNDVTVNGGAGDDDITLAAATATTVNAGDDNDTITLGANSDATVDGGDGTDTVELASGDYSDDDLVLSNIEAVNVTAGNAADISSTTFAGDNTFELVGTGNLGTSFITVSAETANDTVIDASGVTTGVLTAASVNIDGNDGDDTITHNAYSGVITGGAGNDTISGLAGDDTITGGTGADTMTGGAGGDTFVILAADNDVGIDVTNDAMDTITDFTTGTDVINIAALACENDANDVSGAAANDVSEVFTLANDALNADNSDGVIIVSNAMGTGDSYVYIDANNNGTLDDNDILIILEGATPVTGDFI